MTSEDQFTTTTKRLDEILSPPQQAAVEKIVSGILAGTRPTNDLRDYLRTQKRELAKKEIDCGYLFYALVYKLSLPL